jgi:Uma2 family endonuclease
MVIAKPAVTADELSMHPNAEFYELVDGQLVERKTSAESSCVGANLNRLLGNHVSAASAGDVFQSDLGYQCFADPELVRKPDGSFIRKGRLPADQFRKGHVCIAPDLVIEALAPNELATEVIEKVEEYLQAGVRLVWVIDAVSRTAKVHRADGTTQKIHEQQDLDGEEVVPGFRCTLGNVLPPKTAATAKPAG